MQWLLAGLLAGFMLSGKGPESAPRKTGISASARESAAKPEDQAVRLQLVKEKLRPLHERPGKPQPGEWLFSHPETGQGFDQWRGADPVMPDAKRRIIYVQPLGYLTPAQARLVTLTAEYLSSFFNLPVKLRESLPLSVIPVKARPVHPQWGTPQVLTSYVLNEVLKPRLPDDAMAYIAFTASDLWPGAGWNFVFGQATLRDRVGVWSIQRYGDADESDEGFRLALLRTLKVAVHETGHMFSIAHCTAWRCVMAGSNSLEETDRDPLWLCPECLAKILWASHADPVVRYRKLAAFCEAQGLVKEAVFFRHSIALLEVPARPR